MFDLLVREEAGAVPVPLPGRVMVFAGADGLYSKDQAGTVKKFEGRPGVNASGCELAALAYLPADQALGNSAWTAANLAAASINKGGAFDTAQKKFIVPQGLAGLFAVSYLVTYNASSLSNVDSYIRKNGVYGFGGTRFTPWASGWGAVGGARIMALNAGDSLDLMLYLTGNSGRACMGDSMTYMSVHRIGDAE